MKKIDLLVLVNEIATSQGHSASPARGKDMGELTIIKDGAIAIADGRLQTIGPRQEVLANLGQTKIEKTLDLPKQICVPGFVDAHTHTVFAGSREDEFAMRIAGTSYMEILQKGGGIIDTVRATRAMSYDDLLTKTRQHLDRMLEGGTTTAEIKSGYGLDFATEIKMLEVVAQLKKEHPMDLVSTFMGAHALPPEYKGRSKEFIEFMAEEVLPHVAKEGLAEYCDIFCEEGVFDIEESRQLLLKAKELGLKVRFHADEMVSSGGAQLAAEIGADSADHLLEASLVGIRAMAQKGVIATLLPATPFSLMKEKYAPARKMIEEGLAVALASDFNPGSCPTHSMSLVLTIGCLNMKLTPEEGLNGITINGAHSIGRGHELGSLEIGKKADLVILDLPNYRCLPYFFGVNYVDKVIKAGQLVVDKGKVKY